MRMIKFRAWDGKRMTTSGIMFNCSLGLLETPNGAQMNLMQFTGLTDKNGVEIFESDLLQIEDRIVQVVWHERLGQWDTVFFKEHGILFNNSLPNTEWNIRATVVGNIYQNAKD